MIEFFSHFSTYTVAAMMVSLFVALSLISLLFVRRFCKPLLFTEHTEFGDIFFQRHRRGVRLDPGICGGGGLAKLRQGA